MGISRVAYAELGVSDINEAAAIHTDVLGFKELGREDGAVRFGCGIDGVSDLILREGRSGVHRFGVKVDSSDDIAYYAKRLADAGIHTEQRTDVDPGVRAALSFTAPSGHIIELVDTVVERGYLNPSTAGAHQQGIRARDFDHITLSAQDAGGLTDFIVNVLEGRVSDIFQPAPGVVGAAWTRFGQFHHDIAVFGTQNPNATLHHYALVMDSFEHLGEAADVLSRAGIQVEVGPGRHGVGGNQYCYFWINGNRYELSANMPRVDISEPGIWPNFDEAFSPWGHKPPASMAEGS